MKIFWSWQSDTHQPSGRHFVRDVLIQLAKDLNGVDQAEEAERPDQDEEDDGQDPGWVDIDHDTLGVGGSPRIADTILRKIDQAAVFVADVTPVGKTQGGKFLPNPNVMIELGYALRVIELERIVLVMNRAEGAALKNLPFDLRHWRGPVTYALTRDATDDKRGAVAEELKNDLRRVIDPGLKAAAKAFKEKKRKALRAPDLAVALAAEKGGPFVISQRVEDQDLGVPPLQAIQLQTPFLDIPKLDPIFDGPDIASRIRSRSMIPAAFSRPKPIEHWTKQEKEGFNRGVERYYAEYQSYLEAVAEHARLESRSIEVNLVLHNVGTLPATNIDVEITFPEGIILHGDEGGPPERPTPPATPELVPPGTAIVRQTPFELPNISANSQRSMSFDSGGRRVHVRRSDLKHHMQVSFAVFIVSFATREEIRSFQAEYLITANESVDPVRGTIEFDVELID